MINDDDGVVHSSYFRIQNVYDDKFNIYQHKYICLGIARNILPASEIYLSYFFNIFTRAYYARQNHMQSLKEEDISQFFILFLQIYVLKSLFGSNHSLQKLMEGAKQNLFNKSRKAQQQCLLEFSEIKLRQFYRKHSNYLYTERKNEIQYIDHVLKIENQITRLLNDLLKRADDQDSQKQMIQRQYLPDCQIIKPRLFIGYNIKAILNIKILWKLEMIVMWKIFNSITGHFHTKIPIIRDTGYEKERQYNSIYLPAQSNLTCSRITCLNSILNISSQFRQNKGTAIIKGILNRCYDFYKKTKTFFPNLSSRYIYMDYQYNKPLITFEGFLLHFIGLVGSTKTLELRLATYPQNAIDFEQSYLQTILQNKILLERRYFFDRAESQQIGKQQGGDRINKLEQKIHVMRLIYIIYRLKNGRSFIDDYSQGKFRKFTSDQMLQVRYYHTALRKSHEDFQNGTLNLAIIFPKTVSDSECQNEESGQAQDKNQFSFTLIDLMEYLDIYPIDQLFQSLKLEKISRQFDQRQLLIKQIDFLISRQITSQQLINPKKAFIISLVILHEDINGLMQVYKKKGELYSLQTQSALNHLLTDPLNYEESEEILANFRNVIQQKQTIRRKRFIHQILLLDPLKQETQRHRRYVDNHKKIYDFITLVNAIYIILRKSLRHNISQLQSSQQILRAYENILSDAFDLMKLYPGDKDLEQFYHSCAVRYFQNQFDMDNMDARSISNNIDTIRCYDISWSKTSLLKLESLLSQIKMKLRIFVPQQVLLLPLSQYHRMKLIALLKTYLLLNEQNAKRLHFAIEILFQQCKQPNRLTPEIQKSKISRFKAVLENIYQ